jgi:AcrR family transcriptional regulator
VADRPDGPERPLRADARRNREKVLRAAREAFAAAGFGAPLDEIAARAGVGPGTVYRHFPTKEALFEAVVATRMEDLVVAARAAADADDAGEAFFSYLARIKEESAAKRDMPDAIAISGPLQEAVHSGLALLLRRAQQAGAVRDDITTPDLITAFKAAVAAFRETSAPPATRERVFTIIADGLRPPPASRGVPAEPPARPA